MNAKNSRRRFTKEFKVDGAGLNGTNFRNAVLDAAGFIKADLTAANFENTIYAGGYFWMPF
jgi:uncharacterized protein YjbI with pentapeptide repeats